MGPRVRHRAIEARARRGSGLAGAAIALGIGAGRRSPDPELTARTLSAVADESARLLLTDPRGYPIERVLAHARWLLDQFWQPASTGAGG